MPHVRARSQSPCQQHGGCSSRPCEAGELGISVITAPVIVSDGDRHSQGASRESPEERSGDKRATKPDLIQDGDFNLSQATTE